MIEGLGEVVLRCLYVITWFNEGMSLSSQTILVKFDITNAKVLFHFSVYRLQCGEPGSFGPELEPIGISLYKHYRSDYLAL